jgi:hypothetical protein
MPNMKRATRDERVERIIDELARAYDSDPWHGPSLTHLLEGVTHDEANGAAVPGAHSIWELVLHIDAWTREVTRRLSGAHAATPLEGDWPPVPAAANAEAWASTRANLASAQRELRDALERTPVEQLERLVGDERSPQLGTGITYEAMLHGLAQHHAYHGGQIALLRRALERRA